MVVVTWRAGARLEEGSRRTIDAPDAPSALDALLRWHVEFALGQPGLITVQSRELDNVPEPARRQIRRLQRLYVEEWVTVLSEMYPLAPQARLRTAVHAVFGLLNSTPHSAVELPAQSMSELLFAMARSALLTAAEPVSPPADSAPDAAGQPRPAER